MIWWVLYSLAEMKLNIRAINDEVDGFICTQSSKNKP